MKPPAMVATVTCAKASMSVISMPQRRNQKIKTMVSAPVNALDKPAVELDVWGAFVAMAQPVYVAWGLNWT